MTGVRSLIANALFWFAVACRSNADAGPTIPAIAAAAPPPLTVSATPSIEFTPAKLTVPAGSTVTFAFGSVPHNVFFDDGLPASPAPIGGQNVNVQIQRTFSVAGVYNYTCHLHSDMRGTVVVTAP